MTSAQDTAVQKLEAKSLQQIVPLTCSRVGIPNICCNDFASNFCTAVSRSDVMVKFLLFLVVDLD